MNCLTRFTLKIMMSGVRRENNKSSKRATVSFLMEPKVMATIKKEN